VQPTLEQVKAAATALIDADRPAYMALSAKIGKPSTMPESDYAKALAEYAAAMPVDDAGLM
jgi:hypothetical protein